MTRGLDYNVRLKPSGIDWIGDVPEHWEIMPLKRLAHFRSGDTITSFSIDGEGAYPVYGGNGLQGYTSSYTHDGDYILIGRQGALCGNVNYAKGQFWASEHAVVVAPAPGHNVVWLGELLSAMNLNQYSQSAAQPGLAVETIQNLAAPVAPKEEQKAIAVYIESEARQTHLAASCFEREIALLREYRTRLIADVVTGKLDVRGVIEAGNGPSSSSGPYPSLPDEAEELADLDPGEDAEVEEIIDTEETTRNDR